MKLRSVVMAAALIGAAVPAWATTAYITDSVTVTIFPNPELSGEPLERLVSGTLVDILQTSDGVAQVKTGSGNTGWLRTTFLTTNLPAGMQLEEARNQVSKTNVALDKANARIAELEKEAAKVKDLGWMKAELNKTRNQAEALEKEVAGYKKQLAAKNNEPPPPDPSAELQAKVAELEALNADLEQRLAATLLINSEVDLMVEPEVGSDTGKGMIWMVPGLVLGLLAGSVGGYRWFTHRLRRRLGGARLI